MIVFRMRIIPIIVIADLFIGISLNTPGVFADPQRDDGTDCPGSRRTILPTNCIAKKRGEVIVNYNENNNLNPGKPDRYRPGGSNVDSRPPYPVAEFEDDEDESFDTSFDFDDWRRARAQRRGTKVCENKGGKRGVVNVNYYENGNGPQPGAEPPRPAPEIFDDELPPVLGPFRPSLPGAEPLPPAPEIYDDDLPPVLGPFRPSIPGAEPLPPAPEIYDDDLPPVLGPFRPSIPGAEPLPPAPEIFDDDLPPVLGPPRPSLRPSLRPRPRPSLRPSLRPRPRPSLRPRPRPSLLPRPRPSLRIHYD